MKVAEAARLAREKLNEHGLTHTAIEIDRAVKRRGQAEQRPGTGRTTLRLSELFIESSPDSEVLDTILHEIAHLLAWRRYGTRIKPHGREWKRMARYVGATPVARRHGTEGYKQAVADKTNWQATCNDCKRIIGTWIRKSKIVKSILRGEKRYRCNHCKSNDLFITGKNQIRRQK